MGYRIWIKKTLQAFLDETLYGKDTSTRPDADSVKVGTKFIVTANPLVVYISDGTQWVEL